MNGVGQSFNESSLLVFFGRSLVFARLIWYHDKCCAELDPKAPEGANRYFIFPGIYGGQWLAEYKARRGGGCASETNRRMTTRRLIWALCDHPKSMMDDDGDERSDCIRNWRNSGRTSSASSPTCRPRTAKCSPSCSSGKRPETPPKSKWATAITKSKYSKFDLLLHEFFLFFVIL